MAKLATITAEQLRAARKAGFKRKAPKKPKQSASVTQMENYIASHNQWVKDAKSKHSTKAAMAKKKAALKKQIFKR